MLDFDYYIQHGEPSQREKAEAWAVAIGLQDVDGLKPSAYLLDTAQKHIEGQVSYEEAKRLVNTYYETLPAAQRSDDEEEADKVSLHITQVLSEKTFTFSPAELANIHRRLFTGVLPHAGRYREVNITKKEWVLNGDTVLYASYDAISATLAYDFEQERRFSYKHLTREQMVAHLARFIAGIWQIHPFREGNTRTTAIFLIKYLRKLGFDLTNEPFAEYAKYFRNALVRANYQNYEKGIEETTEFLELFLRNVLYGEQNELKKRYEHIDWKQAQETLQQHEPINEPITPSTYPLNLPPQLTPSTSTDRLQEELHKQSDAVKKLIRALASAQMSKKEMMTAVGLKDRTNFEDYYLAPALNAKIVRMLYPNSPNHPKQKYLLTKKGSLLYQLLTRVVR